MKEMKKTTSGKSSPDHKNLEEFSRNSLEIIQRSQELVEEFTKHYSLEKSALNESVVASQISAAEAFNEILANAIEHPEKLIEASLEYYNEYLKLLKNAAARINGENVAPLYDGDKRFRDEAWEKNLAFDFIKQSYLLASKWLVHTVDELDDDVSKDTSRKVEFYTKLFVEALSPSNFFLTNPEVLRETAMSNGENLVKGLKNLLADLKDSKGWFNIRMADDKAFKVGKNLATTKGKVVYQNDLMQLIQYSPTTEMVYKTPVLVVSAWINKYYILDMRPDNSFIKWLVDKGYTVFAISWVNPDSKLAEKSFEDYMKEGPLAALDAIEKATGENHASVVSYCLGGTLMAATLAYLKAKKKDSRIKSATFLTALTDFSDAGDLRVFVDDTQIEKLEQQMKEKGYLDGREMALVFSMLRANDLIWSFVVNNYMLGKDPFPFDLLYWNADSTRLPAKMHSFYLRRMYRDNALCKGEIELDGVKIDLTKITTPSYFLSTAEDHIAPWKSTYAATKLFSGPLRFVLSASGHIAGVINPPTARKYSYKANKEGDRKYNKNPEKWFAGAKEHGGSWWKDWYAWMVRNNHTGGKVKARKPGGGKLKPLEDAPGSYVKVKTT